MQDHKHIARALLLAGTLLCAACGGGGGSVLPAQAAGGRFVLAGWDEHQHSADGTAWKEIVGTPEGGIVHTRTVAAGGYVVTSYYDGIGTAGGVFFARSLPDPAWTEVDFASTYHLRDLAWGNGVFVAVGEQRSGATAVYRAVEPHSWTRAAAPPGFATFFDSIIFAEGRFVLAGTAFGRDGAVWVSADGDRWFGDTVNGTKAIRDVHFAGRTYMALGLTPADATVSRATADPEDWNAGSVTSAVVAPTGGGFPRALAFGAGRWIAVGRHAQASLGAVWASDDAGRTWRRVFTAGARLNDVAFGGARFVAAGDRGYVIRSDDGLTWSDASIPGGGEEISAVSYIR